MLLINLNHKQKSFQQLQNIEYVKFTVMLALGKSEIRSDGIEIFCKARLHLPGGILEGYCTSGPYI